MPPGGAGPGGGTFGGPGGRGFSRGFLTEEEKANRPKVTGALLRRVFSYLLPYWKQMLLVLIAIAVSSVFSLTPSVLTGRIIDEGLIGRNFRALVTLILLSLAVTLGANLIGVLESYLNSWIAQHITYDLRNTMYAHLQQMPQSFFTSHKQGDIITRMTSDISGVQQVVSGTLASILSNSITLIVALLAMYQKNWMLATLGVLIIPLFIIPTRSAGKTRWSLTREAQECSDEINGILNETLSVSGQLLVKLFCKEQAEYARYEAVNRRMIRLNIREGMAGRWFRVALSTFASIGPMLLYLAGGILIMRGDPTLTVGDITVFVALLGKMYGPVNQLLNIQVDWIRSMAMFTRIFEYLDMPVEIQNAPDAIIPDMAGGQAGAAGTSAGTEGSTGTVASPDAVTCPDVAAEQDAAIEPDATGARGRVVFDRVCFSYSPERQILRDVSFTLEPGKSIAIVGPSGSGKSTIVHLIPRLYDVDSGSVSFDGIDVRRLDLGYLRRNIGIVSQETYLFNGTIRDNLLYAKADASEQELEEACRTANIWDFISSQEQGLDSFVGNRGLKLSGGEKQRISIARVLLKDPALLIFDEATSALDSISERKIQDAIEPLIDARTSILIAHRLSTILAADEILVVQDGTIVERGTHEELVDAGGMYTRLYETQFRIGTSAM